MVKDETLMQRILILIALSALLGLTCASALAQGGSLQGYLLDGTTGDSLSAGVVRLDLPSYPPGFHRTLQMDSTSAFRFDSLPEGVFTVSGSLPHHGFASEAVEISADVTTFVTLRLNGGSGRGESQQLIALNGYVSIDTAFDGTVRYYADCNGDGTADYRLVFGPMDFMPPYGNGVRPQPRDTVQMQTTLFSYGEPPLVIVREIRGQPWIPDSLGHGGAEGDMQTRDGCRSAVIVRFEATGSVEVYPPWDYPTDSTTYALHYFDGRDSMRIQLDFGRLTYQPGDSVNPILRPHMDQVVNVVGGFVECPAEPMNRAIVYEMNQQLWRVPGDTVGFGMISQQMSAGDRGALPASFLTLSNYPNPFNSTTTITYTLPLTGNVTLTVLDLLGRNVELLANGRQPSGTYSFNWNGSGLASGLYFCRVQTGNASITRRMLLLK